VHPLGTGQPPGLDLIKRAVDPLLSWMPAWAHSAAWTVISYLLILVIIVVLVRHAIPWLLRLVNEPMQVLLTFFGIVLLLPEYLITATMRRLSLSAPSLAFNYGDLIQKATIMVQRAARAILSALQSMSRTPKIALALALVVAFLAWDGSYCVGKGQACVVPTTQWVRTVEAAHRATGHPSPSTTPHCERRKAKRKSHKRC
jgi:hypothetical protein